MNRGVAFAQSVILALAGGFFFTIGQQVAKFDSLTSLHFTNEAMTYWGSASVMVLIAAITITFLLSTIPSKKPRQKAPWYLTFLVLFVLPVFVSQADVAVSSNPYTAYERIALALAMIAFANLPMFIRHTLIPNRTR
ncbi:hypothetical protein IHC87_21415 (plasmid) [Photobacterium damselae subsp. damselae]|uniref:hypothetical protein n=1 Tax=Photobacterium damselae TaxID=38293 RepID=UPI001F20F614|nr:hypothetical protein [Photobacterium damselae]UJZ96567.1 hypothetical protein IHC87_21415 [Photobacterium damselae subsp. damselae]UKA00557.1 hypothetical protein IHC88_21150 [Photobacterium damselae subsp. damselae]